MSEDIKPYKVCAGIVLDDVPSPMSETMRCLLLPKNAEKVIDFLWVVHNGEDWLEFIFLEQVAKYDDGRIFCERLMQGCGPIGLQECRHTYWGSHDDKCGYIFYPNKKNIIAALDWLSAKGFDL